MVANNNSTDSKHAGRIILFAGAAFALTLSAGLRTGRAADASAPPAAGGEKVAGPAVKWDDMNKEQRGRYMKEVITPKMKVVFQDFDAKLFKTVNCATCHGKEFKARKFKMPNPDIHPLPSTPEAFQAMMKKEPTWPKWTKFMAEKVEPTMASLLGMVPFDPKKPDPTAFSCQACHTLSKP